MKFVILLMIVAAFVYLHSVQSATLIQPRPDEESNESDSGDNSCSDQSLGFTTEASVALNAPDVDDAVWETTGPNPIDDTTTAPVDEMEDVFGVEYNIRKQRKNVHNRNKSPTADNTMQGTEITIVTTRASMVCVFGLPVIGLVCSTAFYFSVVGADDLNDEVAPRPSHIVAELPQDNEPKNQVMSAIFGDDWAEELKMCNMYEEEAAQLKV